MLPVKCCQRGLCGLLWRLKACSTALPAQAADLRKGNLGRSNGRVAPALFTALCTGPVPPTIFHMRTSVCGACSDVCVCVCVRELGDMPVLLQGNASFEWVPVGACVVSIHKNLQKISHFNLKHSNMTLNETLPDYEYMFLLTYM